MGVLVVGVGYIGSQLVSDLASHGKRVVGIDNFSATSPASVRDLQRRTGLVFRRGSILNRQLLQEAFTEAEPVECVYHLAAQASAHPEAATPRYTENTNLLGARLLFETAAEAGAARLVFASSMRVYGPCLRGRIDEGSPYGRFRDLSHLSKCYAEKLLEMVAFERGLSAVSVRLGICYGLAPVMKTDDRYLTVPHKFCRQAVDGEVLRVDPTARGLLGFLHVADAAVALQIAAQEAWKEPYVAVNAAGELYSVPALAAMVQRAGVARGLEVRIEGATDDTETSERVAVVSRLDEIGFRPRHRLAESLDALLDYYAAAKRSRNRR